MVYLPSPELNPVEGVWSHLKLTALAGLAALGLAEPAGAVRAGLRHLRHRLDPLHGFLAHTRLRIRTRSTNLKDTPPRACGHLPLLPWEKFS
ncbi:transposase [Thermobifida halotolerans]